MNGRGFEEGGAVVEMEEEKVMNGILAYETQTQTFQVNCVVYDSRCGDRHIDDSRKICIISIFFTRLGICRV